MNVSNINTSPKRKRGAIRTQQIPRLRFGLVFVSLLIFSICAQNLFAHDGGFGHSRRLIYVSVQPDSLIVEYRLKQGLEEAIVEMVHVDTDRNGKISDAERDQFFTQRGKALLANLEFRDGRSGKPLPTEFESVALHHSLVQVYRVRVLGAAESVQLVDRNFPHKPGQVAIETGPGLKAELPEEIDFSHADQVRVKLERVTDEKP